MKLFLVLGSLTIASALWAPELARAEPQIEIRPAQQSCSGARGPFEVFASGLEPNKDLVVDMVAGGVVTPGIGGRSEPDGRFYSPIPMVVLPCATGGTVTAVLRVDGTAVTQTTFEVLPPGATPVAPLSGNSAEPQPEPDSDWLYLSAIGGGLLMFTLLVLLGGPRRR
jgi:hypothetical protein